MPLYLAGRQQRELSLRGFSVFCAEATDSDAEAHKSERNDTDDDGYEAKVNAPLAVRSLVRVGREHSASVVAQAKACRTTSSVASASFFGITIALRSEPISNTVASSIVFADTAEAVLVNATVSAVYVLADKAAVFSIIILEAFAVTVVVTSSLFTASRVSDAVHGARRTVITLARLTNTSI